MGIDNVGLAQAPCLLDFLLKIRYHVFNKAIHKTYRYIYIYIYFPIETSMDFPIETSIYKTKAPPIQDLGASVEVARGSKLCQDPPEPQTSRGQSLEERNGVS